MAEQEKKAIDVDNLEVAELEDQDLEDVAGGGTNNCVNTNCPCQPHNTER